MDTSTPAGSAISSNTLFHFTKSYDALLGILANGFEPRFCLEDFSGIDRSDESLEDVQVALPMVCFCDLPLSQAGRHLDTYGNYGIGLTKEWGQRNGLGPVLYIHGRSKLWRALNAMVQENFEVESDEYTPVERNLVVFGSYLKPYAGRFWRNGTTLNEVRFYDEREWRYVPDFDFAKRGSWSLPAEKFQDDTVRAAANAAFRDQTLNFEPCDIRYIIVNREAEVLELLDAILRIKGDHFSHNDLRVLTTKIISSEQIRQDF